MKFSDTNYFPVPNDEECVLNASGISKEIDEPATTVRSWADKHGRYLYIKKINGRWTYTQASIEQFRFIKDLCRNKNFSHIQISEHIKQHGFNFNKYDGGIVDPNNPLSYQAFASALALENKKQLNEFLKEYIKYQNEKDENLIEKINIEVEQTLVEKNNEQSKYIINKSKEYIYDLNEKNKQTNKEHDINLVENLRDILKDDKIKAQEREIEELKKQLKEKNKGLFSKLLHKKN